MDPTNEIPESLDKLVLSLVSSYDIPAELIDDAAQQIALYWYQHEGQQYQTELTQLDFHEWLAGQKTIRLHEFERTNALSSYEEKVCGQCHDDENY